MCVDLFGTFISSQQHYLSTRLCTLIVNIINMNIIFHLSDTYINLAPFFFRWNSRSELSIRLVPLLLYLYTFH